MDERVVAALRRKTGIESDEMNDAVLMEVFAGTFNLAGAELHVAFAALGAGLMTAMPRWLRRLFRHPVDIR